MLRSRPHREARAVMLMVAKSRPTPGYSRRLPGAALAYLNLRATVEVVAGAAIALLLGLVFAPADWRWIVVALVAAGIVIALVVDLPILNRLAVRYTTYQTDDHEVRIRRGVLFTRDLAIATPQIIDVTVLEGPFLRRFGLAKVAITTITHVEPLGPVTLAEAEVIRTQLLSAVRTRRD